jgi:hypothetical protein
MPYVICSDCRLVTYSTHLWATTEQCPHCARPLPTTERAGLLEAAAGGDSYPPVTRGKTRMARMPNRDHG